MLWYVGSHCATADDDRLITIELGHSGSGRVQSGNAIDDRFIDTDPSHNADLHLPRPFGKLYTSDM